MAFDDGSDNVFRISPAAEIEEPRRPGRPKGSPKVPGSGRKPGQPNRTTAELRGMIVRRGRPLELLCAVAAGRKVKTGHRTYQHPTLQERLFASRLLMERLLPAPKPAETDTDDGDRIDERHVPVGTSPEVDRARRLAFILSQGVRAAEAEAKEQERDDDD